MQEKEVDIMAKSIGRASAVFNVFARQFVAHRGFPFEVVVPVAPDEQEFTAEMNDIYRSMKGGKATERELAGA